jgi:enoyl-CoA hydratase/carnithine racemase
MRFTNPRFLGRKYDPVSLDNVNLEREGEIAILTLNNPNRRNALSLCVMLKVLDYLNDIEQDRSIRAVILAAVGNVYCSGHDLSELIDRTEDEYHHIFAVCTALMTRIQSIPQPVVAEVQGMATAAGCQLVATCEAMQRTEHLHHPLLARWHTTFFFYLASTV